MVCRGPSLFFRTVVPPFLSFLLPALFSASRVFPLSDAGLPSAAFHAHSFPGGFFSLFLFFRLCSVWRFRLPVPFSLRLFPHFARSASGYFPSLFGLALPASRSVFVTSFPAFRPVRLRLFSVFVRFGASRFRFPPPACSVPNNPSSCLAVRFPPRTARNDDADCSGGAGRACGGIGRPCGTGEPAGASSAVGTETSRRGGFRASVRGADTGRPSRVRSIRLPVAAGTAEAVRHGAVSTAQGCSVSFFTL